MENNGEVSRSLLADLTGHRISLAQGAGLGGQRFKLAISRPRDATNNKQQQPFFSYLPSTSSGSFISVAVAGSGTFAASHSERGAIEREAFESFLEPVAGGCLASC